MTQMVGRKFNRLEVVKSFDKKKWECVCECGNTVYVDGWAVRSGNTKSCGCLAKDDLAERRKIYTDKNLFYENVIPEPNTGCWIWMGSLSSHESGGYGIMSGKHYYAHRASYELFKGPIPKGLDLDHLCRLHCCVNPDHLEPVTRSENFRRGIGPWAINARRTHCKHGHPLEPPHLYIRKDGKRMCRTCMNRRLKEARTKKRGAKI